jgi:hypothetical protein
MGSIYFSQIFLEVGIGGEHPKVDLTFISVEYCPWFSPNSNKMVTNFWGS